MALMPRSINIKEVQTKMILVFQGQRNTKTNTLRNTKTITLKNTSINTFGTTTTRSIHRLTFGTVDTFQISRYENENTNRCVLLKYCIVTNIT